MNNLSREKQIEVVAALTEGLGIRATDAHHRRPPRDDHARLASASGAAAPSCTTA